MTFYDEMRDLAQEMTRSDDQDGFGQLGAIRRTEVSGGGPSDPTGGTEITIDYPIRFTLMPVEMKDVDGTFIRSGDWNVTASALPPADAANWDTPHSISSIDTITVEANDLLVTPEGILTIVDPGRLAPGGSLVMYQMTVRKA